MKMLSPDFSRHHTYEIAANLLVVVAYPNPDHEPARAKCHAELCAIALGRSDLDLKQVVQLYNPDPLHTKLALKEFTTGKRFWAGIVVRDRLAALVTPAVKQMITNTTQAPTKLPTLLSLYEQYAELYNPKLDRSNFIKQIWYRSVPVLPLMLGVRSALQVDDPDHLHRLFFDPTVSKRIISHANYYNQFVMGQWGAKIKTEDRWIIRDVTPN